MWPFRHNSLFSSKKKSCNPHTPFSFVAHNTIPGRKKIARDFTRTTSKELQTNLIFSVIHSRPVLFLSYTCLLSHTVTHSYTWRLPYLPLFGGGGGGVSTTVTGTALAWGSCERYSFTFLSKCAERQSHENKMLAGNVSANTFMSGLY